MFPAASVSLGFGPKDGYDPPEPNRIAEFIRKFFASFHCEEAETISTERGIDARRTPISALFLFGTF